MACSDGHSFDCLPRIPLQIVETKVLMRFYELPVVASAFVPGWSQVVTNCKPTGIEL